MHPALLINQTGLAVQEHHLMAAAHNLANVSTHGFKRNRAVVVDQFYRELREAGAQADAQNLLPSGMQLGTGARVEGMQRLFTMGNVENTSQALDMAIIGPGFFQVQQPDGTSAYTRNGQFQLSADGQLVTAAGIPLEPSIIIPAGSSTVTVSSDGVVSVSMPGVVQPQVAGQLSLVNFTNPMGLRAMGGNLFVETEASGSPIEGVAGLGGMGALRQYALESSNVEVVEELVNLIMIQRAYEMNARAIDTSDKMLEFLVRHV
ncbi:MAG: flagellar basal-body rod protein FlgG [Kistimonas sp.]|nr:flagellar basal-body rod protein FlgG [Kistimonas sp.]